MVHFKSDAKLLMKDGRLRKCLVSFAVLTTLTGCLVDSIAVDDEDLIAEFLVQNDNGQTSAIATFGTKDLAGSNDVELIARESISYRREERGGRGGELRESDDGEYRVSLGDDTAGWYSFTLERMLDVVGGQTQEIIDNYAYLPNTFQSVQAEPLQTGSVVSISWAMDDNFQPSINGFTADRSEDTFNAIATCQAGNSVFEIEMTDEPTLQQNGVASLEIPIVQSLTEEQGLSADAIAAISCELDVQLVRTIDGITDVALSTRSSASGQILENVGIQWLGQ